MNYYLGIFGGVGTNPSAALLKGKKIIAFAEEERFTRIKNAPLALPINSIHFGWGLGCPVALIAQSPPQILE